MLSLLSRGLLGGIRSCQAGGVIVNEHCLTRAQTHLHLEVLGRWFEFIGLDQLRQRLERPGRRPFCLLTFDDGKRSNATEVAPELVRRGIPAVFYLPTEFISEGEPLWFDRCRSIQRALGYTPAELDSTVLKALPLEEIHRRLERFSAHCGTDLEMPSEDVLPMSWDQARALHRHGFACGAHGVRHAILTVEPEPDAFREIEQSLARVSTETGEPCTTFAFPNGNFNSSLSQHAWDCGARFIMTTEPMWADRRSRCWRLPRIQLFGQYTPARIELKLALAALRGALPNPDGSGRAYRLRPHHTRPVCHGARFAR